MQIILEMDKTNDLELAALQALIGVLRGGPNARDYSHADSDRVPAPRPPVAPEPVVPTPPTSTGPSDTSGLPHDSRIHSTPPTTNADGTWRKRRGVDDATIAAVTAELRAGQPEAPAAPEPTPGEPNAAPVSVPPAPSSNDVPPAPTDVDTSAAISAAEVPAPPTPDAPASTDGFATFGVFVQAMNSKPGAVYQKLNEHAVELGAVDFKSLKDRPDLWQLFFDSWEG